MPTRSAHATSTTRGPGTASQRVAQWVSALRYDDLPPAVATAAKLHALDTVGVSVAGAVLPGESGTARAGVAVFQRMGGRGEASVIGNRTTVPAANAAFGNACLAHALDFDDIHTASRVHASTTVTPAVLAVAERLGSVGEDVVTALVAGNEVATRIGMGGPVHFQKHGFHATAVAGVLGAAAGACRLLGLDEDATARAFGIAADVAGGTNAWIARGDATKHLHAGWAAHNGIIAADLAQAGAEGPPGAFEGRYGLYEALTGYADVDLSAIVDSLGHEWETPKMAYKAYPSCYWMHGSLDAALEIRGQILDQLDRIASITAIVPTAAVAHVLEPEETRVRPLTPYAGKFSLQFSAAAMLLRGEIDLSTYTPRSLADADVLDLAARVDYQVSSTFDAGAQLYPGGLRVVMLDGRELVAETPEPRGTELNPLSEAEVLDKFRSTAGLGLPAERVIDLEHALTNLEHPGAVSRIGSALRHVPRGLDAEGPPV